MTSVHRWGEAFCGPRQQSRFATPGRFLRRSSHAAVHQRERSQDGTDSWEHSWGRKGACSRGRKLVSPTLPGPGPFETGNRSSPSKLVKSQIQNPIFEIFEISILDRRPMARQPVFALLGLSLMVSLAAAVPQRACSFVPLTRAPAQRPSLLLGRNPLCSPYKGVKTMAASLKMTVAGHDMQPHQHPDQAIQPQPAQQLYSREKALFPILTKNECRREGGLSPDWESAERRGLPRSHRSRRNIATSLAPSSVRLKSCRTMNGLLGKRSQSSAEEFGASCSPQPRTLATHSSLRSALAGPSSHFSRSSEP